MRPINPKARPGTIDRDRTRRAHERVGVFDLTPARPSFHITKHRYDALLQKEADLKRARAGLASKDVALDDYSRIVTNLRERVSELEDLLNRTYDERGRDIIEQRVRIPAERLARLEGAEQDLADLKSILRRG